MYFYFEKKSTLDKQTKAIERLGALTNLSHTGQINTQPTEAQIWVEIKLNLNRYKTRAVLKKKYKK